MSLGLLRTSLRSSRPMVASLARSAPLAVRHSSHAAAEDYDSFNKRYADFFAGAQDLFELQRGLNNCFAYDLVPSQQVVEEALKAARRVNDYSTAVRIFEGLKEKVENPAQYQAYLDATEALRKDLGVATREELYSA
ncbi:cytochrome-c oxidase chain VI [Leucosporidium creatinivorum]|uniref:Cytochrome c oxidase subunit 6, mitochondrial n=1 Tax=Leucosporidium creatinivorum TaxID=106004 RepID=A0A1Y2D0I9_9BASI|nr:cytochrome-c oxidase chain VI [Leucosporidium creatinivorum]